MARYVQEEAATICQVNYELEKVKIAFEDTLSRKQDEPNAVLADIDMNSYGFYNVGYIDASMLLFNGVPVLNIDTNDLSKIDTQAVVNLIEPLLIPLINKRLDEIFTVQIVNGEPVLTIDTVNDGGAADGPTV